MPSIYCFFQHERALRLMADLMMVGVMVTYLHIGNLHFVAVYPFNQN